jgi:phosphoenolpyruvate carboxylase
MRLRFEQGICWILKSYEQMKAPNRDMLVLVKEQGVSSEYIQMEMERIHQLLISFETIDRLVNAHEVMDLNRYKRLNKYNAVVRVMQETNLKPFIFIVNKN